MIRLAGDRAIPVMFGKNRVRLPDPASDRVISKNRNDVRLVKCSIGRDDTDSRHLEGARNLS
jgi:hypothetical protein